jgi:hypothetical protein
MGQFLPAPEIIRGTEMIPSPPVGVRRNLHRNFVHYAAPGRPSMAAREHSRGAGTGSVMVCDRRCCAGCSGIVRPVGCPLYGAPTTVVAASQVVSSGCRNRNHHHRPSARVSCQNGQWAARAARASRPAGLAACGRRDQARHVFRSVRRIDPNAVSRAESRCGFSADGTTQNPAK